MSATDPAPDDCPFQGLLPFTRKEYFVGREHETRAIIANLVAAPLTVLYGPSGSGKTSVLQAGVVPDLRKLPDVDDEPAPYKADPIIFRDWQQPNLGEAIRARLVEACPPFFGGKTPGLNAPLDLILASLNLASRGRIYLIFDQFEEYLIFARPGEAGRDLDNEIARSINRRGVNAGFLLSLREDSLSLLDRLQGRIPHLMSNRFPLEHLSPEAARRAITEPFDRYNKKHQASGRQVRIESALTEQLVRESAVREPQRTPSPAPRTTLRTLRDSAINWGFRKVFPGFNSTLIWFGAVITSAFKSPEPPRRVDATILQFFLKKLWEQEVRAGRGTLTEQSLAALGGERGILVRHVDAALAAVPRRHRKIASKIAPLLATGAGSKISETSLTFSRWAHQHHPRVDEALKALSETVPRLIRASQLGNDAARYELVHDRLGTPFLEWSRASRLRRRALWSGGIVGSCVLVGILFLIVLAVNQGKLDKTNQKLKASVTDLESVTRRLDDANHELSAAKADAERAFGLTSAMATAAAVASGHWTKAADLIERVPRQTRNWEWGYLCSQLDSSRLVLEQGWVGFDARWSPDGRRVLTVSSDDAARIWNALTGELLVVLPQDYVGSAEWSPDGSMVVTASTLNQTIVWNAADGSRIAEVTGESASFSPDGLRILTWRGNLARLWSATRGVQLAVLSGHHGEVLSACFSPDGTRIVTASKDRTARLWDAFTGLDLGALDDAHFNEVVSARFSSNGTCIITASMDGTARVWTAATLEQDGAVCALDDEPMLSACFSADDARILTTSYRRIDVWNAHTGERSLNLRGHKDLITSASWSEDGDRILTSSMDGTARLWNARNGGELLVLRGHAAALATARLSPDAARVVTVANDNTARIWTSTPRDPLIAMPDSEELVTSASFSPSGDLVVTVGENGAAAVWDTVTGEQAGGLGQAADDVLSAIFGPDGSRIALNVRGPSVRVWDMHADAFIATFADQDFSVRPTPFSPDGDRLLTVSPSNTVREQKIADDSPPAETGPHANAIWIAAYSPDGTRFITSSLYHSGAYVRSTGGASPPIPLEDPQRLNSAVFSLDGTRILTTSDGDQPQIQLWNAANGTLLQTIAPPKQNADYPAFSPDGRRILVVSFDVAALIDPAQPTRPVLLRGHQDLIVGAAFNPDGSRVVTTSLDATVRVWDSLSGQELVMLPVGEPGPSPAQPAAFTADGTRIAAVSADGVVHLWDSVPQHVRRADHLRSKLGYPGEPSVSRWIRMATGRPSWNTPETVGSSR